MSGDKQYIHRSLSSRLNPISNRVANIQMLYAYCMARLRSVQLLLGVGTTAPLLEHVQLLQSLTSRLHNCLTHEAANHVQVADLNGERLVIQVDSTAWATRLRYLGPQLLRCLRKDTILPPLLQLDIRVVPLAQPAPTRIQPMTLSADSASLLEATADGIRHTALRTALKRLARRGNRRPPG